MTDNAEALSLSLQSLVGWKFRSGTRLSRRKQWVSGFFEPLSLGAFGLLGRPPHSYAESSASQRGPTPPSQSSLRGQGGPRGTTEGSASEAAARRLAPKERDLLTNTIS